MNSVRVEAEKNTKVLLKARVFIQLCLTKSCTRINYSLRSQFTAGLGVSHTKKYEAWTK